MAGRGLSAAVLTEIAKGAVRPIHLVKFQFTTVSRLTDSFRDISWDSQTWNAAGNLLGIGAVSEDTSLKVATTAVSMSGVNQALIAEALTEKYTDKVVLIYRGLLNASLDVIVDPYLHFDGRVDDFTVNETPGGTSVLTWKLSSHWIDFQKRAGRRTNNIDQQFFYAGDLGFDHATEIITDIKWGRV